MATQRGIAVLSSEHSILEFSSDGGTNWRVVPGIIDYVESGSDVPTRDVVPLADGVQKRAGRPRVASIACQAFTLPQSDTWATLREAKVNRTALNFRFTTQADNLYSGGTGGSANKAAIATTGIVTLTEGTNDVALPDFDNQQYGVGMAFRIGSSLYVVDSFNSSGLAVVLPAPSTAVSASDFSIEIPGVRRGPFSGFVTNTDEWNMASESELQTALMIQPFATLPPATVVV